VVRQNYELDEFGLLLLAVEHLLVYLLHRYFGPQDAVVHRVQLNGERERAVEVRLDSLRECFREAVQRQQPAGELVAEAHEIGQGGELPELGRRELQQVQLPLVPQQLLQRTQKDRDLLPEHGPRQLLSGERKGLPYLAQALELRCMLRESLRRDEGLQHIQLVRIKRGDVSKLERLQREHSRLHQVECLLKLFQYFPCLIHRNHISQIQ